jgi:hypothetical protein
MGVVAGKAGAARVVRSRVARIVQAAEAAYSPEIGEVRSLVARMLKK